MSDEQPRSRPKRRDVVIVVTLFSTLFLFLAVPILAMPFTHGSSGGGASAPVVAANSGVFTMDGMPPAVVSMYEYARDQQALLSQVPCYCGCRTAYNHRSLARCFVRPDGRWERHASGCLVCGNEASRVHELADARVSPAKIRAAVIAQFGPPPSTVSS
jgi:Protein of unknown function with PCYCGC motif